MSFKRILYLHRTQGKGAEGSHIRGMVDAFRAEGFHVDILGPPGIDPYETLSPNSREKTKTGQRLWGKIADSLPQLAFEILELGYNVYSRFQIQAMLQSRGYSFIYERYALNSICGSLLAKKYSLPHVIEVNDATVIERSRPLVLKKLAASIERESLGRSLLIVTISHAFKDLLIKKHGIAPEKILVLPNAVNPDNYILNSVKRLKREALGIGTNQIVLGCVGAFVPWHGLEFMIESLHDLIARENLFILFVGDGPVRSKVECLARRYNISGQVTFTGFVDACEVPYYLDLIDICVIPDSNEHCSPMKLFEYMAMGKAIVYPDYRPLLDTLTHGVNGLVFEKKDANSLLKQITSLVVNDGLITALGKQAKKTLLQKHTWQMNVNKLLKHLNSLMSGKQVV